jgi:hypothetical protein
LDDLRIKPFTVFTGHLVLLDAIVDIYQFILHSYTDSIFLLKSLILWDVMPCSPLKANRRFEGTYHLHLQGGRTSQARNKLLGLLTAFTDRLEHV